MNMFESLCRPCPKTVRPRKPLRNISELAEEFGISPQRLGAFMAQNPAPEHKMENVTKNRRTKWYDPVEMRTWWNALKKD